MNAFAKRFPQAQYGSDRRWDTVLNTKGMVSKPPGWAKPIWGLTRTTTATGSTAANAPAAQTEPGRFGRPVFRPLQACGPAGLESNWVQTVPGKHWFSYFRLYAPTEAYFDKSWKLDDITRVP
nr:hypothetical protein [Pseudomonas sp.]